MTVDDLGKYGMVEMTDEEIRQFLANQRVGVLGLPTEGAPSMRPMSFGFDGESRLYLLYVLGSGSRKAELTDRADVARFLVFDIETMFNWRSVLLTGTIDEVPDEERDTALEAVEGAWRPELFETAGASENTGLYRFVADERVGLKCIDLPPGFYGNESGTDTE